MASHSGTAEPEGEGPSVPLPLSENFEASSTANSLPSTPSPRRGTEPFPLLPESSLDDPFVADPFTPPQETNFVPYVPPITRKSAVLLSRQFCNIRV